MLEKQFKTVPGVEDVAGFGGLTKEYHVDVDADKLTHYQMSLSTLTSNRECQHQRRRQLP